jgi:hypothetical protein
MNKKQLALLLALLALAGVAVYLLKDSFAPAPIQIDCLMRPARAERAQRGARRTPPSGLPGYNVTFAFNRKLSLTAVKVFPLQDVLTNKYPHAIWQLTRSTNAAPAPTRSLVYGEPIRGLRPAVRGAIADPLNPGSSYRLVVEAGPLKAEKDFQIPN